MRRRASLVLLPLAVLALLVGCGDDDSADSDSTTTTAVLPPEWAGGTVPEGLDAPTSAPEPADPEDADFCEAYREVQVTIVALPDDTLANLQMGADALQEHLDVLVATAPDEVQESLSTLADAVAELRSAVNDADSLEEAQEASRDVYANEDFAAAGDELAAQAAEICSGG